MHSRALKYNKIRFLHKIKANLGMAIAKKYVDLMDGKLRSAAKRVLDQHGLHVLLAEDNDLNAEIAVSLIGRTRDDCNPSCRWEISLAHLYIRVKNSCKQKMTSDFMAASIGTNPVIVRKILQQLKVAGLIEVARGTGGVTILRMRDYIITISGVFFCLS